MNITKIDRDGFNHSVGPAQIDLLKNFIEMHYYLSMRDDSEYWKYVSEEIDYNNSSWSRGHPLAGTNRYIDFLNKSWVFRNYFLSNSNAPGTLFVAAGMDYPCISTSSADAAGTSPNGVFDLKDRKLMIEQEVAVFQQFLQTISEGSESLPSTYQYLLDNIYNG